MVNEKNKNRTKQEWDILFHDLYTKYYQKLCVFANTFLFDEDESEEIVQRVMTKLWEQRQDYDTILNINSYLYRSVRNHCINTINHKKIEEKYKSETWNELKALEISAIEEDFSAEKEKKLKQAISTLPQRCQDVLTLSKFQGLKNKEIAEQLNISIKAVEANITRAFVTLRKTLQPPSDN